MHVNVNLHKEKKVHYFYTRLPTKVLADFCKLVAGPETAVSFQNL